MASLSDLKKLGEKALEISRFKKSVDITIDHENFTFKLHGEKKLADIPSPTVMRFIALVLL